MGKAPTDCNDTCQCNGRPGGVQTEPARKAGTGKGCAGMNALATTAPRLGSVWPPQAGLPVHARISLRGSAVKGRFPRWLWHDVAVALDQGGATLVLIHFRATGANRLIKEEAMTADGLR